MKTREEFPTEFTIKNKGEVKKVYIYLGEINTEYSSKETLFEVYNQRGGEFHKKMAKKTRWQFYTKVAEKNGGEV